MQRVLMAIAASALLAGAAQAADQQQARSADKAATNAQARAPAAKKVLYVCSEEERSWRMFSRDLGTPEFVTAEQVRADAGKTWSAPKCITEGEMKRLNLASR